MSLSGSDVLSGLDSLMYKVDGGMWKEFGSSVDFVEFLVDGEVEMPDSEAPFVWSLPGGVHELGVNVVSDGGDVVSERIDVMCIIF
mgnify:CR=1 FL=1